jgi:hypothetical protein
MTACGMIALPQAECAILRIVICDAAKEKKRRKGAGNNDAETTMVAARSPEGFDGVRSW